MSQQIIDAFILQCGPVQEWSGDRASWGAALGAFTLGWLACEKAIEQRMQADGAVGSRKNGVYHVEFREDGTLGLTPRS
jgi:hypothetical protein